MMDKNLPNQLKKIARDLRAIGHGMTPFFWNGIEYPEGYTLGECTSPAIMPDTGGELCNWKGPVHRDDIRDGTARCRECGGSVHFASS